MAELNSSDLSVITEFIENVSETNDSLTGDLHFNCILQDADLTVLGRLDWNEEGDVVFIPPVSE